MQTALVSVTAVRKEQHDARQPRDVTRHLFRSGRRISFNLSKEHAMTNDIIEHDDSRDYRKEFERSMAAIAASQERSDARMDRIEAAHDQGLAEMKEIRAGIQELRAEQKEIARLQKETARLQKETDRQLKETDRLQKETDRQLKEYHRSFNNQWGRLVEALIEGQLVYVLNGRGIEVEFTRPGLKPYYVRDDGVHVHREFDLLAVNGSELVVVEVKTTLRPKDVKRFLSGMRDIGKFYPYWAHKRAYGAMAYIRCDSDADVQAEKRGLFVIRAVGEGAVITNKADFRPKSFTRVATGHAYLRAVPDF